jgi:asparagine N-glycosylation enzyme membrane subunit Stt3
MISNIFLVLSPNVSGKFILHIFHFKDMGETSVTLIGVLVGFLFGLSGIATLFSLLSDVVSEAQAQIAQFGVASTLVLLVVALILIIKVRVLSALVVGAIIGAVLNIILEMNGIKLLDVVQNFIPPLGI